MTTPTPQAHLILKILSLLGIFDKQECEDHKLYLTRKGIETLAKKSFLKLINFKYISAGLNQSCIFMRDSHTQP
jgi:hypothetical protein